MFQHAGGVLSNSNLLTFAGASWIEQTAGESLGRLQVTLSNSMALPPSKTCVLQFADSSSLTWSNAALVIQNWSGSLYGGGSHRLLFGYSASGLTAPELADIQFHNPGGLPAGDYPARILSDGEVVPNSGQSLPLNLGLSLSANGNAQLTLFTEILAASTRIDVSADLQHWSPLTNELDRNGTITILDQAPHVLARFYRAVLLP